MGSDRHILGLAACFTQVTQQYAVLLDEVDGKSVLGVEVAMPEGHFSQCPCCHTAGHRVTLAGREFACKPMDAVEVDFCMKLTHLYQKCWRPVREVRCLILLRRH